MRPSKEENISYVDAFLESGRDDAGEDDASEDDDLFLLQYEADTNMYT